jgi:hypothetical protein
VVIDHLPQLNPPEEAGLRRVCDESLRELGKRPEVYVKISEALRRVNGHVPKLSRRVQAALGSSVRRIREIAAYSAAIGRIATTGSVCAGVFRSAGIFQRERTGGGGEIFLEEFGGRV